MFIRRVSSGQSPWASLLSFLDTHICYVFCCHAVFTDLLCLLLSCIIHTFVMCSVVMQYLQICYVFCCHAVFTYLFCALLSCSIHKCVMCSLSCSIHTFVMCSVVMQYLQICYVFSFHAVFDDQVLCFSSHDALAFICMLFLNLLFPNGCASSAVSCFVS